MSKTAREEQMATAKQAEAPQVRRDPGGDREHGRRLGGERRSGPALHDPRPRPLRGGRVGASPRPHPGQGRAGVRAEGRRVPQVLVADGDQHRRPEVLPRTHVLPRARALGQADDRPHRRHDRRLGPRGRLLRHGRRGRDLRGRAEGDPGQPVRVLQLARVVQRRIRGQASVLGVLHPLDRGLDGVDPRLDPPRGRHLPRWLGLRRQPLAPALLEGAALEGRLRVRAGLLHARRRRVGRHDQVRRQDAARGEDGRARRRPPGRRGVHLVQGQGGAEGARPRGGGLRHDARLAGLGVDPVPEREQLGARHGRLHGVGHREQGVEPDRAHRRLGRRDEGRARRASPDGRGGVGVRRSGRPVRHDDQQLAHAAEHGADQRVEPVLASTCPSTTAPATSRR